MKQRGRIVTKLKKGKELAIYADSQVYKIQQV
jgi:hypothetical protein